MIVIIDNGGQYTHLIWRNARDLGFEGKIFSNKTAFQDLPQAQAFVLSGGPGSAYSDDFGVNKQIISHASVPILGICQGHQLIAHFSGGKVARGASAEYGIAAIEVVEEDVLFKGVPSSFKAWVSHFDEVKSLAPDFVALARSSSCACEAMRHKQKPVFGVQFHPEVWHTEHGEKILDNFFSLIKI